MQLDQIERLGPALAGRYVIQRELGRGGMATVYLAQDVRHNRQVALKVLLPELSAALGADRFLREIQVAARLNHPHILPLFDSGEAGGYLFYVMPFIAGESLRNKLTREKQLSLEEALRITGQVAAALDHAHAHNLIHRDIKPENILLHAGEAVVADFGIALAVTELGTRLTETGMSVGTPEYMSPEQSMGESALDARSDVYSLGCVLFEALTGEPPFSGPTAQAVVYKRMADPVPGVRRLRHAVPVAVEQALMKALAKAPVDRFPSAAAFAEALSNPVPAKAREPSVAVLPFLNLSANPENEFFADGITEDVIANLSKIKALKVISRTSVMAFKRRDEPLRTIASKLEAQTVVEGSVRRAGDRVRIVAQLIDAESDRHLWAETYDRQLDDIFAIQTDVALQIAGALEAELSQDERIRVRQEPTTNLQAYQLYLQGRAWFNRYTDDGIHRAIQYFEQAIAIDPGYAMAYAQRANAYSELGTGQLGWAYNPEEAIQKAKLDVTRALELDPDLGEAHGVLALLKCVIDFDWEGAEKEFKLAIDLSPGGADIYDHYGWLLSAMGRYDESLAMVTRAQEMDPVAHRSDVASTLLRAGRNKEALEAAIKAIEFDPSFPRARSVFGWAYLRNDMPAEGLAELERAVSLAPGNTMYLGQLGQAYAMVGREDDAQKILGQLKELSRERYVSPYHTAYVFTGLSNHDAAMDCLEQAYNERAGGTYGIKGSFLFAPLREHPRFKALLEKMNLS